METIESLCYQLDKLPNSIQTALSELDPAKPNNPFFMSIDTKEGNFFCLNWDVVLFDEKYNTNEKKAQIQPFVAIYAKSFNNGYNDFSNELKKQVTEIFSPNNDSIAKAIFVRTQKKKGLLSHCFNSELSNERCLEFGKLAGEYYKAWELILKNPTQFECFFDTMTDKTPPPPQFNLDVDIPTLKGCYNSELVFKNFKKYLKTDNATFKKWLIDGTGDIKQLHWTYEDENIAQLRALLNALCNVDWKPNEIKTAFKLKKTVDSNNRIGNLNSDLSILLEKCRLK